MSVFHEIRIFFGDGAFLFFRLDFLCAAWLKKKAKQPNIRLTRKTRCYKTKCLIFSTGALLTHIITVPLDSENLTVQSSIFRKPVGMGWRLKAFLSMTNKWSS